MGLIMTLQRKSVKLSAPSPRWSVAAGLGTHLEPLLCCSCHMEAKRSFANLEQRPASASVPKLGEVATMGAIPPGLHGVMIAIADVLLVVVGAGPRRLGGV